ncbi:MAG: hypothetical protein HN759_11085 [Akkermansiaceae bacterium]|jgi:hypothetical protein|nr:hypothetical protein [Akkermansiaceae bacterium]
MKYLIIVATLTTLLHAQWSPEQKQLINAIKPTDKESAWMRINWRTNLWQARKEAAKSGKPIYLWEMDGHPLGCT